MTLRVLVFQCCGGGHAVLRSRSLKVTLTRFSGAKATGKEKGEREGGRGVERGGDRALKWRYTEKHSIEESAFYRREHIL